MKNTPTIRHPKGESIRVNMPSPVYRKIQHLATQQGRSLSAMCLQLMEQALKAGKL